jgi:hypothetical protein
MLPMIRHLRSLGHLLLIWLAIAATLAVGALLMASIDPLRF